MIFFFSFCGISIFGEFMLKFTTDENVQIQKLNFYLNVERKKKTDKKEHKNRFLINKSGENR